MGKHKNNLKSRNMKLLLYPDNEAHALAFSRIQDDLNVPFIGILHHDGSSKDHWHVYLCFQNPRYCSAVAQELGLVLDSGEGDTQFVRPITGRFESALVYLTHTNTPEKEQYSAADLIGDSELIEQQKKACLKYRRKELDMSDSVLGILAWIQQQEGIISMFQFGMWVCNSPYFRAASSGIVRGCIEEHNKKIYEATQRDYIRHLQSSQERLNAMIDNPQIDFGEWEGDEFD
ncbi:MAG: hypothetical protein IJ060_04535 [Oscillospiraceae bacterium]|nr:hypothetical protein [Oscillospiraceae bacterium]